MTEGTYDKVLYITVIFRSISLLKERYLVVLVFFSFDFMYCCHLCIIMYILYIMCV